MELQHLSRLTDVTPRKLRYVLDQELLPGLRFHRMDAPGSPRAFSENWSIAILAAIRLLETGVRHESIRLFLGSVSGLEIKGKNTLQCVWDCRFASDRDDRYRAFACLGDGINVRVTIDTLLYDSGWFAPGNPAPLAIAYEPRVELRLDLAAICDELSRIKSC